jgi:hypothetical protein
MQKRIPRSVGGSRPHVQRVSDAMSQNETVPQTVSRIYAAPAQTLDTGTDPRYPAKDTQIENIYLPSALPQDRKARSGILQIANWLFTGRME